MASPRTRLLDWLPRFFSRDPEPFAALRLAGPAGASWVVADGALTLTDDASVTRIALAEHTLASLASAIAAAGWTVTTAPAPEHASLTARVLVDGRSTDNLAGGDTLFGGAALLWSYLTAYAAELEDAEAAIAAMLLQMSTRTAEGEWLDVLGSYYAVPRAAIEPDSAYSRRIIAEVLLPRGNNVAIAMAIEAATGQATDVVDAVAFEAVTEAHDGSRTHNAAINYGATATPVYGLFDVETGFDLEGSTSPDPYQATVRALVARMRDAGTHLRALAIRGGAMHDTAPAPTDNAGNLRLNTVATLDDTAPAPADDPAEAGRVELAAPLDDSVAAPADAAEVIAAFFTTHNASRRHDGAVPHASGAELTEAI